MGNKRIFLTTKKRVRPVLCKSNDNKGYGIHTDQATCKVVHHKNLCKKRKMLKVIKTRNIERTQLQSCGHHSRPQSPHSFWSASRTAILPLGILWERNCGCRRIPHAHEIVEAPRSRAIFGQNQESRPLARPDSLSMRRVFVSYSQPIRFARFDGKSVTSGVGPAQRSRFLMLNKRSAASGDENVEVTSSTEII